jgi:cytochrome P450
MPFTVLAPPRARVGRELPPGAPLPVALQTLACRFWPIPYMERCRRRYGTRFTVYPVDMPPLVFLSDLQDVRAVLGASEEILRSAAGGAVVSPLFGESSFMLRDGEEHMSVRTALLPAFRRSAIQECEEALLELLERELASWPLDRAFPIYPRLRALTLRMALVVFLGDCEELEELHSALLELLAVMASLVLQEPRLRYLPGWRATWRAMVDARRHADELIFGLIRRRRTSAKRDDMLGLLLGACGSDGSPMSDREVRDNLVSVLIAGHETTAAELAWAFQLLAHNPEVQARLAEELAGESGEEYLVATVQEILRHRPVFLFSAPRAVAAPIEIGGWTYRPPVQLLVCTYLLHHDPALFADPQEFRPERFLDGRSPRAWLPWGGGRKRCLGVHLATLELQAVLRAVLSRWSIGPAAARIEHPRWRTVLVTPHAGSRVVLSLRRRPRIRLPGCPAGERYRVPVLARRTGRPQAARRVPADVARSSDV